MQQWEAPATKRPDSAALTGPTSTTLSFDGIDFSRDDVIGQGGSADVYEATASIRGESHTIALKEPRIVGTVSPSTVEDVVQEAETWQRLDGHDHVVGVVDWDEHPRPWIALEYMDGGSLRRAIDSTEVFPVAKALWIGRCLARAVRHGHRHGVSHLDLKPGNVLLRETPGDSWPVPKVADWGLAKHLIEHTRTEGWSEDYAAPEQIDPDSPVRPADYTDIYQLGVIVYELLTGCLPYDVTGPALSQRIIDPDTPPIPPSERRPELTPAVDAAVLTALEHDEDDRYETVVNFRKALSALQGDEMLPAIVRTRLQEQDSFDESERGPQYTTAGREEPVSTDAVNHQPARERRVTWPQLKYDPQRTSYREPDRQHQYTDVEVRWWHLLGYSTSDSAPALVDGTLYFGSNHNEENLHAVDAGTGKVQWEQVIDGSIRSAPAAANGCLFFGTKNSDVYAVDQRDGAVQLRHETGGVISSPVTDGEFVVFGSTDGHIYAVDAERQEMAWTTDLGAEIWSSPMIENGRVYVCNHDKRVYSVDLRTGEQQGSVEIERNNHRTPAVQDGVVYVNDGGGVVRALDMEADTQIWEYECDEFLGSNAQAAIAHGNVYAPDGSGKVYALDAESGAEQRVYDAIRRDRSDIPDQNHHLRFDAAPAVVGKRLYIGDGSGNVYSIDLDEGGLNWSFDLTEHDSPTGNPSLKTTPVVANDTLYVMTWSSTLYALSLSS